MGFPVGQPIPIRYYTGATGQTVLARVVDEVDGTFGGELTLVENAVLNAAGYPGFYEQTWTPDMAGHWKILIKVGGVVYGQLFYYVGQGTGIDVMAHKGYCDSGMGASLNTIVCAGLAGLGDDIFNTGWVMLVVLNINAPGVAPEGQIRDITNYVSATGTFTTANFGANVEENDCIIVARREFFLVDGLAIDDPPFFNSFAHRVMTFLADGDGSGWAGTVLPANTSLYDVVRYLYLIAHPTGDPTADSFIDLIMNKDGGQTFARATDSLEAIQELCATLALASVLGTLADAAQQDADSVAFTAMSHLKGLHDVLWDTDGIAVFPGAAAPANNVSIAEVLRAVYDDTNELQGDWVNGGRLDLIIDSLEERKSTEISFTENREVADAVAEIQIWEQQVNTYIRDIFLYCNLDTLETAGEGGIVTIRAYHRVDGAAYSDQPEIELAYTVGASNEYPNFALFGVSEWVQVTMQCSVAVTAQRACPFRGSYKRTS